jgi:DNA-binding LytR/AlgR family response regulator
MPVNLTIESLNQDLSGEATNLSVLRPLYNIKKKKTRLLVQKGIENILLRMDDIILFYTENKITYVIDRFEKKYLSDYSLTDLERELDGVSFFRANRQYIINVDYVKSFRACDKVKIRVEMNLHVLSHSIIVSQETAPAFRKWMYEA